jgi:hypothetical protein
LPTAEQENHGRGRHRCYGDRLPTPEEFRYLARRVHALYFEPWPLRYTQDHNLKRACGL